LIKVVVVLLVLGLAGAILSWVVASSPLPEPPKSWIAWSVWAIVGLLMLLVLVAVLTGSMPGGWFALPKL
jgi:hypothetical protein